MWSESSWLSLQYLRFRIWLGRRLYKQSKKYSNIIRISPWSVVKRETSRSEYIALRTLQNHNSIRVPRIRRVYFQHYSLADMDLCHIVMEYIPGRTLAQAWFKLSSEAKQAIANQIHQIVQELRRFQIPAELVGQVTSLEGNQTTCTGITTIGAVHEDFRTYDSFLDYWLEEVVWQAKNQTVPFDVDDLRARLNSLDVRNHMVFTHGDLRAENILVDTVRGSVLAIIDWGQAGWMPVYWEHFKALYPTTRRPLGWSEFVDAIFHDEHADAFAAVETVYRNSGFR